MPDLELNEEFLKETSEHLAVAEECLLALDAGDARPETIHRLFRSLHTIKGAASFLDLRAVMALSHGLEDLVGKMRAGSMQPTGLVVDALLTGLDKLKILLAGPNVDARAVDEDLRILNEIAEPAVESEAGVATHRGEVEAEALADVEAAAFADVGPQGVTKLEPAVQQLAEPVVMELSLGSLPPRVGATPSRHPRSRRPSTRARRATTPVASAGGSVRIPVATLDKLMDLASELVLVRNQNLQAVQGGKAEQLPIIAQRLNLVTSELQASVMQTRMRPVKPVFGRFTRVVRDLARSLGKDVEFDVQGEDVELDKSIIEAIGDPLTHLIRNALDHGIELPEERRRLGKRPRGRLTIRAVHRAGQVLIELRDDGRGIDPRALTSAAARLGHLTPERAAAMPAHEALNLVFLPGFSTSKTVTDVSGRGVGMDAVQAAFKALGGVVDIASEVGEGTTITVKLPLTLAIVPALIITIEGMRFAVPQAHIHEVVLLYGDHLYQDLKTVDGREVYTLRGRLLPVVRLATLLGIDKTYVDPATGKRRPDRRAQIPDRRQDDATVEQQSRRRGPRDRRSSLENRANIVVLKAGGERFGLVVDSVVDTEEIVVKPLHDQLAACVAYAGTTVLGDGHIALILDIAGLVELAAFRFRELGGEAARATGSPLPQETVLLFDIGGPETFAVPLRMLARVESVRPTDIHVAGGQEYLAFRDSTLPLVRIDRAFPSFAADYEVPLLYVVVPRAHQAIGILATAVRDTVRVDCEIDAETVSHACVFGSFLVGGRLALLLDLLGVAQAARADLIRSTDEGMCKRVLLVEDSPLYASLISPSLQALGLAVRLASNGAEALRMLQSEAVDIIVSDIDMPTMDGLELARRVRASELWRDLPMLAISAAEDEDLEPRAIAAGFDAFRSKQESKLVLDALLAILAVRRREVPDV